MKLRDVSKSAENGEHKKKRVVKAERKDADKSVDAPLLAVNMDKLVHEELKSFILDYCRVKLSTIGTRSVFTDSIDFKVLKAIVANETGTRLSLMYVGFSKIKGICEKLDFETQDDSLKIQRLKDAIVNLTNGDYLKK